MSAHDDERVPLDLLLQLLGSLTLADHMGDVGDDVNTVLERLGLDEVQAAYARHQDRYDEWQPALRRALHEVLGTTTLYGTVLHDPDDSDSDEDAA